MTAYICPPRARDKQQLYGFYARSVNARKREVAIHFLYYNFGRIHKTLRVTPAMAAGIADHVWNLEEIALLAG
jgi:hypothetical protein